MIKAVFFDFDGVLCKDYFYTTLQLKYPKVLDYINKTIFRGEQQYANRWMCGEFTYKNINKIISKSTGIPIEVLNPLFIKSVKKMQINKELIKFAMNLKRSGVLIALVTNNMDVFNEVTIPHKSLDAVFPVIVNSFDYGVMKHEQNGRLFDIALKKIELSSFKQVLLIDDSIKACSMFKSKGGMTLLYTGIEEFKSRIKAFGF